MKLADVHLELEKVRIKLRSNLLIQEKEAIVGARIQRAKQKQNILDSSHGSQESRTESETDDSKLR